MERGRQRSTSPTIAQPLLNSLCTRTGGMNFFHDSSSANTTRDGQRWGIRVSVWSISVTPSLTERSGAATVGVAAFSAVAGHEFVLFPVFSSFETRIRALLRSFLINNKCDPTYSQTIVSETCEPALSPYTDALKPHDCRFLFWFPAALSGPPHVTINNSFIVNEKTRVLCNRWLYTYEHRYGQYFVKKTNTKVDLKTQVWCSHL